MISGQLFGILLLNLIVDKASTLRNESAEFYITEEDALIVDGLVDIEGTTGLPMEHSTGPPVEGSGPLMEDYEDSTPFQCNDQNLPGGSDKPSSKARSKSVLNLLHTMAGNALERVQRVHEPADLWDITF